MSLRDYLPLSEFQWISDTDKREQVCDDDFVNALDPEGDRGYVYEISIRIPRCLHDELSDLPPLPEKIVSNLRCYLIFNVNIFRNRNFAHQVV